MELKAKYCNTILFLCNIFILEKSLILLDKNYLPSSPHEPKYENLKRER